MRIDGVPVHLLSFDPGKRTAAWAAFERDELKSCGFYAWTDDEFPAVLEHRFRATEGWHPTQAVIEMQQIYTRGKGRTRNPADVLSVTLTAGRIAQALGPHVETSFVIPHDWKGSVPADTMVRRVISILSPSERAIFRCTKVTESLRHNVADAIGIGLWKLGRLGRLARKNASCDQDDETGQARQANPTS